MDLCLLQSLDGAQGSCCCQCVPSAGQIAQVARLGATPNLDTANSHPHYAVQQPSASPGLTTVGENALPKNPFADTQTSKPSDSATSELPKPLTVHPEVHKPTDTPATTANGGAVAPSTAADASASSASNGTSVNGSGSKLESLVPEDTKQTSTSGPAPATEKPDHSISAASGPSSLSTSAPPPVMTGALPPGDQSNPMAPVPNPTESAEKDGVEDITGANAVSEPTVSAQTDGIQGASVGSTVTSDAPASAPSDAASSLSDPKPKVLNGAGQKDDGADTTATNTVVGEKKNDEKDDASTSAALPPTESASAGAPTADPVEKKDVEMEDAAPVPASKEPFASGATPASATAPATDISGVLSTTGAPTTTPALATPSTAAGEATGGKRKSGTDAEVPAAKKQKGAFSRAVDKAKEAVKDVKEKAKPGRKPGKREKKEIAPVGRTERKTRSQARAE